LTKPHSLAEAFEEVCMMDAPLNVRLAAYAAKLRELNFPFAEAYDDLVSRLIEGQIGAAAPSIGDIMPPFLLPGRDNRLVSLEDLLRSGPLVLSFNRGHWCPFCRIELKTIASHHKEIVKIGGRVVSILPEKQEFAQRLRAETLEDFTILSDIDNGYALSLGLVMWLGERLNELMQGRGHQASTYQGRDGWFVPLPATFVLASDGRTVARHVDPDFRRRMEIDDILTALRKAGGGVG
jgi:peroxiredoxin